MSLDTGWTDLHCHFLPGLDDGPADLDETVEMLRIAHRDGTRELVATPHLFHPVFPLERSRLEESFHQTLEALGTRFRDRPEAAFLGELCLHLGAECHLGPELLATLERHEAPTLGDSDVVLIEPPSFLPPAAIDEAVRRTLASHYRPLLAHVERYPALAEAPGRIETLVAEGCLVQVNAATVAGMRRWRRGRALRRLFRRELVHVVASDGHGPEHRPPTLLPARQELERRFGIARTREWLAAGPRRLLATDRTADPADERVCQGYGVGSE